MSSDSQFLGINYSKENEDAVGTRIRNYKNQIIAAAVVTLGSFGTGTVFGWSAVANDSILKSSHFGEVSREMISWVTSLAIMGAFLGGPMAGFTMDFMGRKSAILVFSLPFLLGWVTMCSAYFIRPGGFFLLYIGRLLTGICAGSYLVIVPTYIKEISSDSMRGILGSAMPLMLVIGILYTFIIGTFCDWSVTSALCGVPPIFLAISTCFIPETPRFLIKKNKMDKAVSSYKWLYMIKSDDVAREKMLDMFSAEAISINDANKDPVKMERRGLVKRHVAIPILIMVFVMFFQQCGGVNAVTLYTVEIFELAGNFIQPHTATIILGVEQVVFVLLSMFLVDIVGRKTLLISCNLLMGVSLLGLGAYFYLKEKEDGSEQRLAWLPIVTIYTYMAAYSCGVGSVPWVLANEIYNPEYRAESATIMTSSYWIFGFLVAKTYDNLISVFNVSGSFWFYGAFCLGGSIFALLFVPETKGKSSEEILKHFGAPANNQSANNNYSDSIISPHEMHPIMSGDGTETEIHNSNNDPEIV